MKSLREEPLIYLIIAIAVFLRIFALDNIPGLLGDEAWGFTQLQLFSRNLPYTFEVPSGRWFNPFYGIIIFITRASDPFWMRFPSFVIGVLTVVFAFRFFRNIYEAKIALLISLFIACFPPHIHYSRLAWDCCLIPLFSLFLTYLPLNRKYVQTVFATIFSFWIHPSLTFMAIPAGLLFLYDRKHDGKPINPKLVYGVSGILGISGVSYIVTSGQSIPMPSLISLLRYVQGCFDFLTGTIVTQDPLDNRILPVLVAFGIFLIVLIAKYFRLLTKREQIFFAGSGITLIVLFILRGVWAVFPGHERTILYLGVPFCLLLALLLGKLKHPRSAGLIVSVFYLAITFVFYFSPAISTGGHGIQTHTGPEDPKYSAIRWILNRHNNDKPLRLVAEGWGIYWNSYNFALDNSNAVVEMLRLNEQAGFSPESKITSPEEFEEFLGREGYAIGFRGGSVERIIFNQTVKGIKYSRVGFKDYADQDYIYVWVRE